MILKNLQLLKKPFNAIRRNIGKMEDGMDLKISSLAENDTWSSEELPKNSKAVPCKWVYKIKRSPIDSIDVYKARLVDKWFTQCYGINHEQTYRPVRKMGPVHSVLSIAANESMLLYPVWYFSVFLYGTLDEDIFMKQPEGYRDGTSGVCSLKLNGFKQASWCEIRYFGEVLSELTLITSEADSCSYVRHKNIKKLVVCLYVDGGFVAAADL